MENFIFCKSDNDLLLPRIELFKKTGLELEKKRGLELVPLPPFLHDFLNENISFVILY